MIRIIVIIILSAIATGSGSTLKPTEAELRFFSRTIDFIFADSFNQAYRLAGDFIDPNPGRPMFHLIYGSILHAAMLDSEDYSREKEFFAHIDSSIDALEKWSDDNHNDPWSRFFLGSAYGYKAILYTQKGSWLKSFINGIKAKNNFGKAIDMDPTLYDAYTGMGNYHYWSTVKLGKYIPFLPDNREKGIEELMLAADSSLFSRLPAKTGLAWALINEKRIVKAIQIGKELHRETGGGRNALWILGGAYWRAGNLILSAEYYGQLIDSYERAGDQNYYNLIFCRYRRGVCLAEMRRDEEARREFDTLLSYKISRDIKKRLKDVFNKTGEYLVKLDKRKKQDIRG